MRPADNNQRLGLAIGIVILVGMLIATFIAPEFVQSPDLSNRADAGVLQPLIDLLGWLANTLGYGDYFPKPLAPPPDAPAMGFWGLLGTNYYGVPYMEYALQGAQIVTGPALVAGGVVGFLAILAGISRCAALGWTDTVLQAFAELVGALPRLVIVLVLALICRGFEYQGLLAIAVLWALLSAPGAMDEASATAERLGGSKFVEALRAHGFTAWRIYVYHIIWLNLRSVIVRQAAEVGMQVVFLEIALSYLAASQNQPSFTHPDSNNSWAIMLYDGYSALVGGTPLLHSIITGLILVAVVAFMAQAFRVGARAR